MLERVFAIAAVAFFRGVAAYAASESVLREDAPEYHPRAIIQLLEMDEESLKA
jgi:hypothetical protein